MNQGIRLRHAVRILYHGRGGGPLRINRPKIKGATLICKLTTHVRTNGIPRHLANYHVCRLSLNGLLTNARCQNRFRGELGTVVRKVQGRKRTVMCVSRVRGLVNTKQAKSNSVSTSGVLGPCLRKKRVQFVNSAACRRFGHCFSHDEKLMQHFRRVSVRRPKVRRAVRVIRKLGRECRAFRKMICRRKIVTCTIATTTQCVDSHFLPSGTVSLISRTKTCHRVRPASARARAISGTLVASVLTHVYGISMLTVGRRSGTALRALRRHVDTGVCNRRRTIYRIIRTMRVTGTKLLSRGGPLTDLLFINPAKIKGARMTGMLTSRLNVTLRHFSVDRCARGRAITGLVNSPTKCVNCRSNKLLASTVHGAPGYILLLSRVRGTRPSVFGVLLRIVSCTMLASGGKQGTSYHRIVLVVASGTKTRFTRRTSVNFDKRVATKRTVLGRIGGAFGPRFVGQLSTAIIFRSVSCKVTSLVLGGGLGRLGGGLSTHRMKVRLDPRTCGRLLGLNFAGRCNTERVSEMVASRLGPLLVHRVLFKALGAKNGMEIATKGKRLDLRMLGRWCLWVGQRLLHENESARGLLRGVLCRSGGWGAV